MTHPKADKIIKKLTPNKKRDLKRIESALEQLWLEMQTAEASRMPPKVYGLNLMFYGERTLELGCLKITEGDVKGWQAHERMPHTFKEQLRLRDSFPIEKASFLIASAIAFGKEDLVAWAVDYLEKPAEDPLGEWEAASIHGFLLWLGYRYLKHDVAQSALLQKYPLRPPYDAVVEAWNSPESLDVALQQACDHHLDQTTLNNDVAHAEFDIYGIIPVEIVAMNRVRVREGLDPVDIDHPLMSTAFATPPDAPTGYDPETDEALIIARRFAERFEQEQSADKAKT